MKLYMLNRDTDKCERHVEGTSLYSKMLSRALSGFELSKEKRRLKNRESNDQETVRKAFSHFDVALFKPTEDCEHHEDVDNMDIKIANTREIDGLEQLHKHV